MDPRLTGKTTSYRPGVGTEGASASAPPSLRKKSAPSLPSVQITQEDFNNCFKPEQKENKGPGPIQRLKNVLRLAKKTPPDQKEIDWDAMKALAEKFSLYLLQCEEKKKAYVENGNAFITQRYSQGPKVRQLNVKLHHDYLRPYPGMSSEKFYYLNETLAYLPGNFRAILEKASGNLRKTPEFNYIASNMEGYFEGYLIKKLFSDITKIDDPEINTLKEGFTTLLESVKEKDDFEDREYSGMYYILQGVAHKFTARDILHYVKHSLTVGWDEDIGLGELEASKAYCAVVREYDFPMGCSLSDETIEEMYKALSKRKTNIKLQEIDKLCTRIGYMACP